MADMSARLPIATETTDSVRARLTRDTVVGLDPADTSYPDVVMGSILDDLYGVVGLEADRLYDLGHSVLPASVIPTTTTGEWLDDWAEALGLERKDEAYASGFVTFTVTAGTAQAVPEVAIPLGAEVAAPAPSAESDDLSYTTTAPATIPAGGGTVTVPVIATQPGALANVPANTVQILETNVRVASLTNVEPITGGADVEDDEALRARVLLRLAGGGGNGNVTDYTNWALAEPGVGTATVQPNWNGPGTVRVVIATTTGDPAGPELVDRLQGRLDPAGGAGLGVAPVGAVVTVATPSRKLVTVAAALRLLPGFSLDGEGGTRVLRDEITAAIAAYFATLRVGQKVLRNKVLAAVVDVDGVDDAEAVLIAGDYLDVAVGPLEIATLDAPPTLLET